LTLKPPPYNFTNDTELNIAHTSNILIAIEIVGACGREAYALIFELGRHIASVSGKGHSIPHHCSATG